MKNQSSQIFKKSRKLIVLAAMICTTMLVQSPVSSQASLNVSVDSIPQSVDEYKALREEIGKDPQGGIVLFIIALKMYLEQPEVGAPMLVMALDRSNLQEGSGTDSYQGFEPHRSLYYHLNRIKRTPYLANSYIAGTSNSNGYELPSAPYRFVITSNRFSGDPASGEVKYFIASSGASSPRPVRVVRNNRGYWKAKEFSSIMVGVQAPAQNLDDAL